MLNGPPEVPRRIPVMRDECERARYTEQGRVNRKKTIAADPRKLEGVIIPRKASQDDGRFLRELGSLEEEALCATTEYLNWMGS